MFLTVNASILGVVVTHGSSTVSESLNHSSVGDVSIGGSSHLTVQTNHTSSGQSGFAGIADVLLCINVTAGGTILAEGSADFNSSFASFYIASGEITLAALAPAHIAQTCIVGGVIRTAAGATASAARRPGRYIQPIYLPGDKIPTRTHAKHTVVAIFIDYKKIIYYLDSGLFVSEETLVNADSTGSLDAQRKLLEYSLRRLRNLQNESGGMPFAPILSSPATGLLVLEAGADDPTLSIENVKNEAMRELKQLAKIPARTSPTRGRIAIDSVASDAKMVRLNRLRKDYEENIRLLNQIAPTNVA